MTLTCLDTITENPVLTCEPCGKINLTLRVGERRADGYHDLHSLVVGVGIRDKLTLRLRAEPGVAIHCPDAALACSDNLAVRVCETLARRHGIAAALDIDLTKRIPVAGGMGGGSSDGAAALRLANRFWKLGLEDSGLAAIGAALGSDIPLFFALPVAEMFGRGERVQRRTMAWAGWVLLVCVDTVVRTGAVYAALKKMRMNAPGSPVSTGYKPAPHSLGNAAPSSFDPVTHTILTSRRVTEFEHLLYNDLEPAVFRVAPAVAKVYQALHAAQLGPFRVSVAGSTLYRLFDQSEPAHEMARNIAKLAPGVRCIVAAVPTTHGLDR